MKVKNKKILYVSLLVSCILLVYIIWRSLCPVEIVDIHQEGDSSDILVKSFPFTDKGKIDWWLKNKDIIKDKYNIPQPAEDGDFSIFFWLFGDGYKETDGYDRLCFSDMKPPINCIDKNRVFSVDKSKNLGISFTTHNEIYRMKKNGEIVKDQSD